MAQHPQKPENDTPVPDDPKGGTDEVVEADGDGGEDGEDGAGEGGDEGASAAGPPVNPMEEKLRYAYAKTRKSLIERLQNWEDQRSWDDFYKTYWKLIYSVALKSGLRSEEAFDVVQETILSIAKQSREQKYDPNAGSFKSWLMNMTRWRIADQLRKRAKDTAMVNPYGNDEDERSHALDRVSDPNAEKLERIWDNEWQQSLADRAVAIVKGKVSPKQFQIFDAYVIKGWDAKKVTKALGVSMAQVYLAKHRVGGLIKKEIANLEKNLI